MKNLTLSFALFLLTTAGASFAQAGGNLDARVIAVTRSMSVQLGLNELDYIKLKALNQVHMEKAAKINSMYSNDVEMREAKISNLKQEYEKELGSMLSSKQMEAYAAYKENNKNYTAFSAE